MRHSDGTTLFIEGESLLHSRHPFNKLAHVLLVGVAVYCAPGAWIPDAALLCLNLVLAAIGGILLPVWRISWRFLLPLALCMLPIHGFLYPDNHTPLATFHALTLYREGVEYAGTILLQLAAIFTASMLFVFTVRPADLVTALAQAGWPPSFAYLFGSPLLMLPAMRKRIGVIQAAQRARGLDSEGGVPRRMRALAPLVAPLVLAAFSEIEERGIALEVRGFNARGPKTTLRDVNDSRFQRFSRWGMLIVSVALLIFKFLA